MSPRTVATYRDGIVLFLDYATAHLHKQPTAMKLQGKRSANDSLAPMMELN